MKTVKMSGAKFGPINRCIIPESLGQSAYIENASCHKCEAKTSYIEGYCARNIFQELRVHQNIKGKKRPSKKRKAITHFPVTVNKTEHPFPAKDHQSLLILPAFPLPGILAGNPPSSSWNNAAMHCWQFSGSRAKVAEYAASHGAKEVSVSKSVKIGPFVRLLAKIGHTFAIAMRGHGTFKPYLPDIVLGQTDEVAYLIGGELSIPPPTSQEHELHVEEHDHPSGKRLIVVRIRLFADTGTSQHGTPIYYAVAGEDLTR
jgi:hypothetical protein